MPRIRERKAQHYLMLLSIAHNPGAEDPDVLFNDIKSKAGLPERDYMEAEIDRSGLEALKNQLSGKP